jgi:hypothetical protein
MTSLLALFVLAQATSNPAGWNRAEREAFLSSARILQLHSLSMGISNSERATLEKDGIRHDAHVQHIDVYKLQYQTVMGTELNFKDTWKFNMAAYQMDCLLGMGMIPATVERHMESKNASVTWWIDDATMTEGQRMQKKLDPPDVDRWNRQMWVLRVFDQLISNTDRNLGNVVIDKSWNIWLIDHTRAFRAGKNLLDQKNLDRCDRLLLAAIRKLNRTQVTVALSPFVGKMEIDGLMARRDKIVAFFDKKIKQQGEGAVLYDYLATNLRK